MSQGTKDYVFALPISVDDKLRAVSKRMTKVGAATAAVRALAVLFAAMLLAMLIDYLAVLYDSPWRYLLTGTALAAACLAFVFWLLREWNKTWRLHRVASEVDRRLPELEERWSTVAEHAIADIDMRTAHPAMLKRVASEAARAAPRVNPARVVRLVGLNRAALALVVVLLLAASTLLLSWRKSLVLMERFWLPGANISATRIVAKPGNTVVARGEPLTLSGLIQGVPANRATLSLRQPDGAIHNLALIPGQGEEQTVSHSIKAASDLFAYRFRAGDGQTPWHDVVVADPPEIDRVHLSIKPPGYRREHEVNLEKLPNQCSGVVGSQLELAVKPKAAISSLKLQLGEEEFVVLQSDKDGWYRWRTALIKSFSMSPVLTESHGLTNRRPPVTQVNVYPDLPPEVTILSPEPQIAVTSNDKVEIEFVAEDDNAVSDAELVVFREPDEPGGKPIELASVPIPLGDQAGKKKVEGRTTLDLAQFTLPDGAALTYQVRVHEDRTVGQESKDLSIASAKRESSDKPSENLAAEEVPPPSDGSDQNDDVAETDMQDPTDNRSADSTPQDRLASVSRKDGAGTRERSTERMAAKDNSKESPTGNNPQKDTGEDERQESANSDATTATPQDRLASVSPKSADGTRARSDGRKPGDSTGNRSSDRNPSNQDAKDDSKKPTDGDSADPKPDDRLASVPPPNSDSNPQRSTERMTSKSPSANQGKAAGTPSNKSPGNPTSPSGAQSEKDEMAKDSERPQKNPSSSEPTDSSRTASDSPRAKSSEKDSPTMAKEQPKSPAETKSEKNRLVLVPRKEQDPANPAEKSPNAEKPDASEANKSDANPSDMASTQNPNGSKSNPGQASKMPPDGMQKRMLDVPQVSSSPQMRIKVDKAAGSFASQQRIKVEIAVAPALAEMRAHLLRAQKLSGGVVNDLRDGKPWEPSHERAIAAAETSVKEAQGVASALDDRTRETPYAFIGLQIADISEANMTPARREFLKAGKMASDAELRAEAVRLGWNQVGQAIERLADLTRRFETARQEFALADKAQEVKQMYRIFVENAFSMLGLQPFDPATHKRKIMEFKLDDEYLARLKEVVEMRHKLMAELARILAEDPRLRRRFMTNFRDSAGSLRRQVTKLRQRQEALARDTITWNKSEAEPQKDVLTEPREDVLQTLSRRRVSEVAQLALAVGRMSDRFDAWLPIAEGDDHAELVRLNNAAQSLATSARELASSAAKTRQNVEPKVLQTLSNNGREFTKQLERFESAMQQLSINNQPEGIESFKINRLAETRGLIDTTSSWSRRLLRLSKGEFHRAAADEQSQLAVETDQLTDKLANMLDLQLPSLARGSEGNSSATIAEMARKLLALLDQKAAPSQQGAVLALEKAQWPVAQERQQAAHAALTAAEKQFDDMITAIIEELDKLPVQDPIAELLNDPTLDEILAMLEQEFAADEELGIPGRPDNLQVITDLMRPSSDQAFAQNQQLQQQMQQQMQQMLAKLLQQEQQRLMKAAQGMFKNALERIGPQLAVTTAGAAAAANAGRSSNWNRLISELEDDLLQSRDKLPPEQFRTAIEQYYELINREVSKEKKKP